MLTSCSRTQDLPQGGQSGTEGDDSVACERTEPRAVAPEQVPARFSAPLSEVARAFSLRDVPGLWLATGTRPLLSIELGSTSASETTRVANGTVCDSSLEVDARIHSSDGALDAQVRATLSAYGELDAPLPLLPTTYLGPAVWPADVEHARRWLDDAYFYGPADDAPALHIQYEFGTSPLQVTAFAFDQRQVVGAWGTDLLYPVSGPPHPFAPDALLASACADAQRYQELGGASAATPYANAEAALAGMVGTWVRCLDPLPSTHAGLQILPDGTWRDFTVEAGELVARLGLEHEGVLQAHEVGGYFNYAQGTYQVDFAPLGRRAEGPRPTLSDFSTHAWESALLFDSEVDEWPDAVYRRTSLPVRAAAPPAFADGERAGAAACALTEQGIVQTREAWEALLTGDFVLCSGTLSSGTTRLHFDASSVQMQSDDGTILSEQEFQRSTADAPSASLVSTPGAGSLQWVVVASRRPLKLRIDDGHTSAVFSALP